MRRFWNFDCKTINLNTSIIFFFLYFVIALETKFLRTTIFPYIWYCRRLMSSLRLVSGNGHELVESSSVTNTEQEMALTLAAISRIVITNDRLH